MAKLMGKSSGAKKKAAAKKTSRPSTKKKPPASPKKQSPASPSGNDELGHVVAFFRIPVVAVIKIMQGSLKIGDRIWIKGHTTDLKQTIASMQVNHQSIPEARKGDEVGIKVSSRARIGDRVYRISP